MLKKLILHIGCEKTGSTSIQGFLRTNKAALAAQGYALLESPKSLNNREVTAACQGTEDSSRWFVRMGLHTPERRLAWQQAYRAELRQEVQTLPKTIHTVIVSSEHLHSRIREAGEFAQVKSLFDGFADTTQVVVYLRRQDRVAVSLYSTLLRGGGVGRNVLPPNVRADDHYYNYELLLAKWADVFGQDQISPRIFDKQRFAQSDLISDFLQTLGLAHLDGLLARPGVYNESISADAAEMLIRFNQAVLDSDGDQGPKHYDRLRGKLLSQLVEKFPGAPVAPMRAHARAFYDLFSASNAQVANRWFQGRALFDEDFSKYPELVTPATVPAGMFDAALRVMLNEGRSKEPMTPLEEVLRELPMHKDEPFLFRQLAQATEAHNPLLALLFATQAQKKRPDGPAIKRMVDRLRKTEGASACEAAWAGVKADHQLPRAKRVK